jgi:hypothetical protein
MIILSFAGQNVSRGQAIEARLIHGQERPHRAASRLRNRPQRHPQHETTEFLARELPFRVIRQSKAMTLEAFNETVFRYFAPYGGLQPIVIQPEEGSENSYNGQARVVSLGKEHNGIIEGVFEFTRPLLLAETEHAETTSPLTVGGNVYAQPIIEISGGASVTRYRLTWRDRTGHGLAAHLVSAPLDLDPSETLVFSGNTGMRIPFTVAGGRLWCHIDCLPSRTTFVDVYTGASIENTDAPLDPAGLDLAASSATELVYSNWDIGNHPLAASLRWHPGMVVNHPGNRPYTFGMADTSVNAAGFVLTDRTAASQRFNWDDDYDAAVLVSSVPITRIENVAIRAFAGYDDEQERDSSIRASLWQLRRDNPTWQRVDFAQFESDSETNNFFNIGGGGAVRGDMQYAAFDPYEPTDDDVIGIAIGIEANATYVDRISLGQVWIINDLIASGEMPSPPGDELKVTLDSAKVPELTVSDPIDARHIDGVLSNTTAGRVVQLQDWFIDDTTLTIDTLNETIQAASGPVYKRGARWSDQFRLWPLDVGTQAWTKPGDWNVTINWQDRYAL